MPTTSILSTRSGQVTGPESYGNSWANTRDTADGIAASDRSGQSGRNSGGVSSGHSTKGGAGAREVY